jgi:hypothetical protein
MKHITYGGISFFDLLLIVNIVLKLTGVINWSWWVVLWPLWIGIIVLIIFIIIFIKIFKEV